MATKEFLEEEWSKTTRDKLLCISFDGKQNFTMENASGCQLTVKEEHYVVVSFPGDNYTESSISNSYCKIDSISYN